MCENLNPNPCRHDKITVRVHGSLATLCVVVDKIEYHDGDCSFNYAKFEDVEGVVEHHEIEM